MAGGRGGRIVLITSVHEHVPLEFAAAYSAAKAGLGMAAKVMALELATFGVTVNAVAPGHIATPMTGKDGVEPESVPLPPIPARAARRPRRGRRDRRRTSSPLPRRTSRAARSSSTADCS